MNGDTVAILNKIDETRDTIFEHIEKLADETRAVLNDHEKRVTSVEAKQDGCLDRHAERKARRETNRGRIMTAVIIFIVLGALGTVAGGIVYALQHGWMPGVGG